MYFLHPVEHHFALWRHELGLSSPCFCLKTRLVSIFSGCQTALFRNMAGIRWIVFKSTRQHCLYPPVEWCSSPVYRLRDTLEWRIRSGTYFKSATQLFLYLYPQPYFLCECYLWDGKQLEVSNVAGTAQPILKSVLHVFSKSKVFHLKRADSDDTVMPVGNAITWPCSTVFHKHLELLTNSLLILYSAKVDCSSIF
jgi:hypothetical protein